MLDACRVSEQVEALSKHRRMLQDFPGCMVDENATMAVSFHDCYKSFDKIGAS